MIINVGGGGNSGYTLTIETNPSATITVTQGDVSYTDTADASGKLAFNKLKKGTWTITATKGSITETMDVALTEDRTVSIDLNQIPDFTYTGSYAIVNDSGSALTTESFVPNWNIKFLTSGKLTINKLRGAKNGIDVFLVGGGGGSPGITYPADQAINYGGAGGGGYNTTKTGNAISAGSNYTVTIGSGGSSSAGTATAGTGGSTSAFGYTASGGRGGTPGSSSETNKNGSTGAGGSTTYAFGNTALGTYSVAGGGSTANRGYGAAAPSWGSWNGKSGGSGVVVIRNAR